MKKLLLVLCACSLVALPACRKKKTETVVVHETRKKEKRVSGPLSDKEIGWDQEDKQ